MRLPAWVDRKTARIVVWIVTWYVLSGGLSFYNKWLVGTGTGQQNFGFPLTISSVHFGLQWALSWLALRCWPLPKADEEAEDEARSRRTWGQYTRYLVPPAVAAALDIGLSNYSLVFNTLTFYVLCKSTTPIFILLFMFVFGIETVSVYLMAIILVMSAGLGLAVYGETMFDWRGFVLVMAASVASGVRWSLIQLLLQSKTLGVRHPLLVMNSLGPIMFVALFPVAFLAEQGWRMFIVAAPVDALRAIGLILGGGVMAFCMIMVEYFLVQDTSAIVIAVAGTFKEVLTIVISHFVFNDDLDLLNALGLVTVLFGIALFHVYKHRWAPSAVAAHAPATNGTANAAAAVVDEFDEDDEDLLLVNIDEDAKASTATLATSGSSSKKGGGWFSFSSPKRPQFLFAGSASTGINDGDGDEDREKLFSLELAGLDDDEAY